MKQIKKGAAVFMFCGILAFILFPANAPAEADRGAGVPLREMPEHLDHLDIKDRFIPVQAEKVGVIHGLRGHLVVVHRGTGQAYFGMKGDSIYEKDSLNTLADSRCRIKFFNDDVAKMGADSEFSVEEYSDQREKGEKTSIFSMIKGKIKFYALKLMRYKKTRCRVKTPTAVVGVRGTSFGVRVYSSGEEEQAQKGVQLAAGKGVFRTGLLAARNGGLYTDAFCEDGVIHVNGQEVPAGFLYNGSTGQIGPVDPGYQRQFDCATSLEGCGEGTGPGGGGPDGEGNGEGVEGDGTGDGVQDQVLNGTDTRDMQDYTDPTDDQTDVIVDQDVPTTSPQDTRPSHHLGYFSAMMTNRTFTPYLSGVFINPGPTAMSPPRANFDEQSVYAEDIAFGDSFYLDDGGTNTSVYENPYLDSADVWGYSSGDLGTANPVSMTEIGHNAYQEWGHWEVAGTFEVAGSMGTNTYAIDNKGYYIFGEHTPDSAMPTTGSDVVYSGSAYGTYWTAAGGADMSGSFSCHIDFTGPTDTAVSQFELSVSGGGHSAEISGGSGGFHTATDQHSHFEIDSATWQLDGVTPAYTKCHGSVYGPDAENIGGAWSMTDSMTDPPGAQGIFQGSRQ